MFASPDTSVQINACAGRAGYEIGWIQGKMERAPPVNWAGEGGPSELGGGAVSAQVAGGSRHVDGCAREFPRPC